MTVSYVGFYKVLQSTVPYRKREILATFAELHGSKRGVPERRSNGEAPERRSKGEASERRSKGEAPEYGSNIFFKAKPPSMGRIYFFKAKPPSMGQIFF
jgi:hypothetical protein